MSMCVPETRETRSPTFVHAREAILEHRELVDLAELLEQRPQVLLVQVPRDLPDKQLNGILVFHVAVFRMN